MKMVTVLIFSVAPELPTITRSMYILYTSYVYTLRLRNALPSCDNITSNLNRFFQILLLLESPLNLQHNNYNRYHT